MTPRLERPSTAQQRRRNRALAIPNADGSPLEGFVESPGAGERVVRESQMTGWHTWEGRPVAAVAIEVDGRVVGGARMGEGLRADVAAARGDAAYADAGWVAALDLRAVQTTSVTLRAIVYPGVDHPGVPLDPFTVEVLGRPTIDELGTAIPPPDQIGGSVDVPADGTPVALGPVLVRGWALATSSSISHVELSANGVPLGRARLGVDRADVAAANPAIDAPISGFEQVVDLGVLPAWTAAVRLVATPVALDGTTADLSVELAPTTPTLRLVPRPPAPRVAPPRGGLSLLVVTHDLQLGGAQLWLLEVLDRMGAGRSVPCTVVAFGGGSLEGVLKQLGVAVHVTTPFPVSDATAYEGRLAELWAWLGTTPATVALVNTFRAFPGADLAGRHGLPVVWAVHETGPRSSSGRSTTPASRSTRRSGRPPRAP